jgi:hypothetical protein
LIEKELKWQKMLQGPKKLKISWMKTLEKEE